MKKIVFFDLDGTLLTDEKEILSANIEAIKRAREHDIEVCICSGRPQSVVRMYQKLACSGRYIISSNGAEIYDIEAREQLYECGLQEEFCINLYNYVEKYNLFMRLDTKYGRYVNNKRNQIADDIFIDDIDYRKFFKENKIFQITIGAWKHEIIDEIVDDVNKTPGYSIANRFIAGMIPDKFDMINIVNSSVSKGNAVLGLCKYLKINPQDAVAFGDDRNDISMLKAVGHAVVMKNAYEDVKELADEISSENNEPGIALILDRIISENLN